METSDLFWFMGVIGGYLSECADNGIGMADRLAVGAVLDDLCRLAAVPSPLVIELAVGNVRLLPVAEPALMSEDPRTRCGAETARWMRAARR